MPNSPYLPLFELVRGGTVESIHSGAAAVVDAHGNLLAWYGDPGAVTFLRSSAKPFQALPFLENGGQDAYRLTAREIALLCASHSGTDEHVAVALAIQEKTGVNESELLCGVHAPFHEATAEALRARKEPLTPNRHNCSGKHTGMVALAHLIARSCRPDSSGLSYIDPAHPIQRLILNVFAEMCDLPVDQVRLGIDGCSAPNFAIPLRNAALAYARLCDPQAGGVDAPARAAACRVVTAAMTSNPDMVAGPGRFDTRIMEVCQGRILAKGGAEGYQGVGLMPGALGPASPGIGIALKISDGDLRQKVRPAVVLEMLRQLGALTPAEQDLLQDFGPVFPLHNWRKIEVGQAQPCFQLRVPVESFSVDR